MFYKEIESLNRSFSIIKVTAINDLLRDWAIEGYKCHLVDSSVNLVKSNYQKKLSSEHIRLAKCWLNLDQRPFPVKKAELKIHLPRWIIFRSEKRVLKFLKNVTWKHSHCNIMYYLTAFTNWSLSLTRKRAKLEYHMWPHSVNRLS